MRLLKEWLSIDKSLRRKLLEKDVTEFAAPINGLTLDVGGERVGGRSPRLIAPQRFYYVNADPVTRPDILANARALPVRAGCLDAVICLEVLEHVEAAEEVIAEMSRILKERGKLLLSMPFLYRFHEDPGDYQRYTHTQLQRLLQKEGLDVVQMRRQGFLFTVVCDMIRQFIASLPNRILRVGAYFLFLPLDFCLRKLEQALPASTGNLQTFTTGYLILAEKKSPR